MKNQLQKFSYVFLLIAFLNFILISFANNNQKQFIVFIIYGICGYSFGTIRKYSRKINE
jgi:hypothetical protein